MSEICHACGAVAPTKYVEFYQNIGALVMRFHKSVKGNLCKRCIHKYFWSFTGTNVTLGWWGMISIIVTPFFVINNVARYIGCIGLKPPAAGNAAATQLSPEAEARLKPHLPQLIARLNRNEPRAAVTMQMSRLAGVTPADVSAMINIVEKRRAALNQQYR